MTEGVVDSAVPVAPVPSPDAAATATPAPDTTAAPDAQPPQAGEPKPDAKPERTFTQRELDEIVNKARAKESRRAERISYERARREIAESELQRLRQQPTTRADATQAPGNGEKPRPENFKDWDAYNEALVDWKYDQRARSAFEATQRDHAGAKEAKFAEAVQAGMAKGAEEFDDFEDVISAPGVAFTDAMVSALLKTNAPHKVAYNLASNPQETRRIASLDVADQVLEIKKFSDSLMKPPEPTKAPAPIRPGKAEGGVSVTTDNASNYKDWLKARNRELGRTAR